MHAHTHTHTSTCTCQAHHEQCGHGHLRGSRGVCSHTHSSLDQSEPAPRLLACLLFPQTSSTLGLTSGKKIHDRGDTISYFVSVVFLMISAIHQWTQKLYHRVKNGSLYLTVRLLLLFIIIISYFFNTLGLGDPICVNILFYCPVFLWGRYQFEDMNSSFLITTQSLNVLEMWRFIETKGKNE